MKDRRYGFGIRITENRRNNAARAGEGENKKVDS